MKGFKRQDFPLTQKKKLHEEQYMRQPTGLVDYAVSMFLQQLKDAT